jgi:Zn-dependent protease
MVDLVLIMGVLLFSVMIHECAHGWVALLFGDDTAKREGRLSLNIMKHVDLVGTIILPLVLLFLYLMSGSGIIFGWAKPVPVRAGRLRNPSRDYTLVSLAGPVSNIMLAIAFGFMLAFAMMVFRNQSTLLAIARIAFFGVKVNVILGMFNLLPVPPLDGSHVVAYLLPYPLSFRYQRMGRYGILIILLLILTDTLRYPFLFADLVSNGMLSWMYSLGRFLG